MFGFEAKAGQSTNNTTNHYDSQRHHIAKYHKLLVVVVVGELDNQIEFVQEEYVLPFSIF